jgi:transcriptional regulator with XRE-family HTH domain
MGRKLLEVKSLSASENKAVIQTVRTLMKQHGYTFHELSRQSGISIGGLVGIRKESKVSPNVATKVAHAFKFDTWKEMIGEPIEENTAKKQSEEVTKRIAFLEKRVKVLERQIAQISAQLGPKKGRTK